MQQTVTLRFSKNDKVFGLRRACPYCVDGRVIVKQLLEPNKFASCMAPEEGTWDVECPSCHGMGWNDEAPWIIDEFEIYIVRWDDGPYVGSPATVFVRFFGDYDQASYLDQDVFATREEAEQEAVRRNSEPIK